jgi:iron-sulfur cluster assembly protein
MNHRTVATSIVCAETMHPSRFTFHPNVTVRHNILIISMLYSRTRRLLQIGRRGLCPNSRSGLVLTGQRLGELAGFFDGGIFEGMEAASAPVNYKIGNERLIRVLNAASAKLQALLARQGRAGGALRVSVIGGGCSGLQYKMDLVDGPANRDILVESNRVRVVIDPKSALFVSGSELDFSEDLQKGGFKVSNPNAVAHCSCGESFSA